MKTEKLFSINWKDGTTTKEVNGKIVTEKTEQDDSKG
jgi:hypothetical protein